MLPAIVAPAIVLPGRPVSAPEFGAFRTDVVGAADLVDHATAALDIPKGAMPIINPTIVATADARTALDLITAAVADDAPTAGHDAVVAAQGHLQQGINELVYRINGPLPVQHIIEALQDTRSSLQLALDSVPAADPR